MSEVVLRAQENLDTLDDYKNILDVLSIGSIVHFAVLDLDFKIIAINDSWESYGKNRGVDQNYQWIGKSYLQPIEKSSCAGDNDAIIAYSRLCELKSGIINEFSLDYPCNEPTKNRWFRCNAKKVDKDGKIFFIICHFDITKDVEQKLDLEKNNKFLINEKKKLDCIENRMAFGRWSCSRDNQIIELSDGAQKILSPLLKNKKINMEDLANCLEPQQKLLFLSQFKKAITNKSKFNFEGYFKIDKNEARYLVISGLLAKEESSINDEIFGLINDKTKEKKIKNELSHMQKIEMLGKLTAEISHNFNNALSIIRGNLELLREFSEPTTIRFINRIERATNQASDLTDKLNHFMSNNEQLHENFCIVKRLIDIVEMSEKMLGKDIELKTDLPSNAIIINADPLEFDNAILNLIINARDAMTSGGKLSIKLENSFQTKHDLSFANLHIIDEGNGIPADQIDKIFEPFFTTKEKGKGTGLGLSAVRKFIQNSNGIIDINSDTELGTEFIVSFPIIDVQPNFNECRGCKNYERYDDNPQSHILVLEDETDVRSMVSEALTRDGMIVYEASNSSEAKEIVDSNRQIDLLLTDVILGPNDIGTEFAKWFEVNRPDTPVIFTSGYTNDVLRLKKIDTNAKNFIAKPYSLVNLLNTIKENMNIRTENIDFIKNQSTQFCSFHDDPQTEYKTGLLK